MKKTNYKNDYLKLYKNINGQQLEMDTEEYEATIARWELNDVEVLEQKAEAEAKETAKAAIADRLGLTADELKLLLG
jgi:hypothetical protein